MSGFLPRPAALLVVGMFLAQAVWAEPRLRIDSPLWDFGCLTNVSEVTHDFVIRNAGDADLTINKLVSSCQACLAAAMDKHTLAPGATALVRARLNLSLADGPVSRDIALYSNDASEPRAVLSVQGIGVLAYQVWPREIHLDASLGLTSVTAEITPVLKLRAPLSQVVCDDTNILASVSPKGGGFALAVARADFLPRGHFPFHLTVRSADSNDFPCRINGMADNPPDLEILPDRLQFEARADAQTRVLWIRQHGNSPLILLDVVPSSVNVHCEIDPDPSGCNYRVYVTAWQQQAEQGRTNALIVKMRDAMRQERSISVPVRVSKLTE